MIRHADYSDREILLLVKNGKVVLGGNRKLKIFGRLGCKSGKRMKRVNRVFFGSMEEAYSEGYRPCRHCKPDSKLSGNAEVVLQKQVVVDEVG